MHAPRVWECWLHTEMSQTTLIAVLFWVAQSDKRNAMAYGVGMQTLRPVHFAPNRSGLSVGSGFIRCRMVGPKILWLEPTRLGIESKTKDLELKSKRYISTPPEPHWVSQIGAWIQNLSANNSYQLITFQYIINKTKRCKTNGWKQQPWGDQIVIVIVIVIRQEGSQTLS